MQKKNEKKLQLVSSKQPGTRKENKTRLRNCLEVKILSESGGKVSGKQRKVSILICNS